MTFVDLSHPIEHGMITYPGLPAPVISDHWTREASRERFRGASAFHIAKIEMVANTGTYVDAPSHRYEDGADLAALPLERLANLPGIVIDSRGRAFDVDALEGVDVRGRAVIIRTGWSRHFRTELYASSAHPFVTARAAQALADHGAALVGIDSVNIDDMADFARPAHTTLLGRGIPIVEHLTNLAELRDGFRFFAVPAPVRGMGTFPVRAFAVQ